jgi:ApaG protein
MPEAITRGVRVSVESEYVPGRSDPEQGNYFFAYHVTIQNEGDAPVQLLSRHWVIADSSGREQEVRGLGVVGKQPRLDPGGSFRYTSACPISTPIGSMRGTYRMVTDGGETFEATIPVFTLAVPGVLH